MTHKTADTLYKAMMDHCFLRSGSRKPVARRVRGGKVAILLRRDGYPTERHTATPEVALQAVRDFKRSFIALAQLAKAWRS